MGYYHVCFFLLSLCFSFCMSPYPFLIPYSKHKASELCQQTSVSLSAVTPFPYGVHTLYQVGSERQCFLHILTSPETATTYSPSFHEIRYAFEYLRACPLIVCFIKNTIMFCILLFYLVEIPQRKMVRLSSF